MSNFREKFGYDHPGESAIGKHTSSDHTFSGWRLSKSAYLPYNPSIHSIGQSPLEQYQRINYGVTAQTLHDGTRELPNPWPDRINNGWQRPSTKIETVATSPLHLVEGEAGALKGRDVFIAPQAEPKKIQKAA